MTIKRRDEFSAKVIKALERRVNGFCSNPDHRVPTSGPNTIATSSTSIGQAAHICAAAPGGPRYDPLMSKEERASIENAIWLCNNCAKLIDSDTKRFTVVLLRQWKAQAESTAQFELGRPQVSRSDYELMRSVALGDTAKLSIPHAVSAICRMTSKEMERKDPRFVIDVSHVNNQTSITYKAKENVPFTVHVNEPFLFEFSEKFTGLVHHGRDVKISSKAITLEGSPLFEDINDKEGRLVLSTNARREAVLTLEAPGNDSGVSCYLAELRGEVVAGTKSFRFEGACFGGIFQLELECNMQNDEVKTTVELKFDTWCGKAVSTLPYFDKVLKMYSEFFTDSKLKFILEVGGLHVATGFGKLNDNAGVNCLFFLRYIRNVRSISSHTGIPILFTDNFSIAKNDYDIVDEIHERLMFQDISALVFNPTMQLTPLDGKSDAYSEQFVDSKMHEFVLVQEVESLEILGQKLDALKIITRFSKAMLRLTGKKNGESVEVEIVPANDCALSTRIASA